MRKIILFACLLFTAIVASAQISSSPFVQPYIKITNNDTVQVFIFNGVSNAGISYTGSGTTINWYKYSNGVNTFYSSFSTIYPEDATGYTLIVDGVTTHIWVIDYKSHLPVFKTFEPENSPNTQCEVVNLLINAIIPVLNFQSFNGDVHELTREFNITYKTLTWGGDIAKWVPTDTIYPVTLPAIQKTVPAPYMNTIFKLYGDQYASALGITDSISSALYSTNAVISHLVTNVTSREQTKNNEGNFPSDKTPINFSAPIDIQFLSNANEPTTQFYNWGIYKDDKLIINRTDKDHRYTFTEFGSYKVKLTVSNSTCTKSDSITVIVTESQLYVPNVFTPNGDGTNDEFRVAYKSLISFQCWVFNRWGRQVFYWSDPTKGWDGNINGKKATPGPYFYVIKATGSDKKKYKLSGDINLLRGAGY